MSSLAPGSRPTSPRDHTASSHSGASPEIPSGDQHYRAIFEAAGVGIARLTLDGRFVEVNQRFADITGRERDNLIGLHFLDISHPDEAPANLATTEALLNGQQDRLTREKRYVRPDGEVVHVMLSVVLLKDEQGRPVQMVSVVEDISERLRMQEALGAARTAERASKAKTEFLSRMSHELRTPLNAMLGFAQLLRVDPRNPINEAQRQKVEHIEKAGAHLLAMMTDVLDLSRIEAGSLPMSIETLSVSSVLEEALALISNQARDAGLTLNHNSPDIGVFVKADRVRLRQVLVNLLSNAIKYNRAGGQALIEAMALQGRVLITVSDTGHGMTPEQVSHLFEPFNRLGAERTGIEGTGIGLVIVKRLLDLMDGHIEVSSTPGTGTSFRVWLPLARPPALDARCAEAAPRSGFGGLDELGLRNRTVLYAEDNVINVELLRQVMRMRPHWHLDVAYSGQQAITMAQACPPDLLLLDMHLGDMSGLDVSDALATQPATASIPRVALSADAMPDQISEAKERGFVAYLTKPLDVARFLKLLDQCEGPSLD
ncbi:MAG: PAS domain S-box protein [Aquabacterium sp.]|uniref:hybrid sensor histidine kinase/response regulator n=1 Tax=Aquabacterium sp. TaxID=1872578 RepID=UPI0025C574E4|nr:PAS domain-containing hybrid sensor histidine kinase/response regulator [Aquabacterium sp.]MBI5926780.1 PAS domain S-box protein [Aquabacterium sp.]